jgi:hypothetical protein
MSSDSGMHAMAWIYETLFPFADGDPSPPKRVEIVFKIFLRGSILTDLSDPYFIFWDTTDSSEIDR